MRREVAAPGVTPGGERTEQVVDHVELAAERERTVLVALQADPGLRAETVARESLRAVIQVETLFEFESGVQTAAQVFRAFEAEHRILRRAAGFLPTAVARLVVAEDETRIEETIQSHTALRVRRC